MFKFRRISTVPYLMYTNQQKTDEQFDFQATYVRMYGVCMSKNEFRQNKLE